MSARAKNRRIGRTVPGPTSSVVVVGAGLGGMSAALHLAGAGRAVTVIEQNSIPGGRAGLIQDHGYRFDTGPTVLTMPELIEQSLAAVGESLPDWLTLHRLDPAYRAHFADSSRIDLRADPAAMATEIRTVCGPREAKAYERFVAYLRRMYALETPHFIERNLDSPAQLLGLPLVKLALLGGFRRLDAKIAGFFADDRLRRMFSFQALYAGLAPAQALALYAVINYMDGVGGVYFPDGGMHAVPVALAGAAAAHGVRFRYGTTVTRIELSGGRACAVLTADGERIPADAVVINADLPTAVRELLPPGYAPRRARRLRYAPSAVMLHAGSAASYADSAHHAIHFGAAWDETFAQLVDRGELMSDPSFLLSTPTYTDPSLAPPDRQTYYALFPAPNLARPTVDWTARAASYREHMIDIMEARGYPGFRDGIECSHLVTPADWQAQGLAAGTPFGAAHTVGQTGPFRIPTLDRHIENLVYAGANTQPGIGVPMVLVSGRLAAQRITG